MGLRAVRVLRCDAYLYTPDRLVAACITHIKLSCARWFDAAQAGCDHACSRAGMTMMGKCVNPNSTDPEKCCECEEYIDDLPCARCASSAGGCVELCRRASKNNTAGMCAFGDNSAKGLCCTCFE